MSIKDEWREFRRRLAGRFPDSAERDAVGASNGPLVLENGFRLGLFNINQVDCEKLTANDGSLVLATRVVLAPRSVLCIALSFHGDDLRALEARRAHILRTAGNASKVRVYLHESGIYLRQDRDIEEIVVGDKGFGDPIRSSIGCYCDIQRGSQLEPIEVTYIRYLASLLHPSPFLHLGPDGGANKPPASAVAEGGSSYLVTHTLSLQPNVSAEVSIPSDITSEEALRLAVFILSLPRDDGLRRNLASLRLAAEEASRQK